MEDIQCNNEHQLKNLNSIDSLHYVFSSELNEMKESVNGFYTIEESSPIFMFAPYLSNNDPEDDFQAKTVLLIGTGPKHKFPILYRLAHNSNLRIICLNDSRNWASEIIDDFIICPVYSIDESVMQSNLKEIQNYCTENKVHFDGIFTYFESTMLMTSYLASELGLIGIPYEKAKLIYNKFLFRKKCIEKGFCKGECYYFTQEEVQLNQFPKVDFNKKWILKTINGAGKSFVKKVENETEFLNLMELIKTFSPRKVKEDLVEEMLFVIETFFEGHEFDIDALIQNGEVKYMSITDNLPSLQPSFMELGGNHPSCVCSSNEQIQIMSTFANFVDNFGITNGCVHFEAKCTPKSLGYMDFEFFPIECNLRLGGAETVALSWLGKGMDLPRNAMKIALGIEIKKLTFEECLRAQVCLASTNFQLTKSRPIKAISLSNRLFFNENIGEFLLYWHPSEIVFTPQEGGVEYLGWMVAKGATYEEARKNLEEAIVEITFTHK